MSIIVNRQKFADAISRASSAVKPNANKPILANLLLVASADALSVSGTDLERYVKAEVVCEAQPCSLTVNAARLAAIVRSAAEDEITLKPNDRGVEIICGRARWNVQTEDAAMLPRPPELADGVSFRAPCNAIARGLRLAICAADKEEQSRYQMKSVLVECQKNSVAFVGSDGRRMSACELPIEAAECSALVPLQAATTIQRTLPDGGECVVSIDRSWLSVAADDGLEIRAKQLEGRFPRWRDVFPRFDTPAIDLPVSQLLQAVIQVSNVVDEESPGADINITAGELTVTSKTKTGEASSAIPVAYDGNAVSITLNARYVADMLRVVEGDVIELHCKDESSAAVFICDDFKHVIMPLARERNHGR